MGPVVCITPPRDRPREAVGMSAHGCVFGACGPVAVPAGSRRRVGNVYIPPPAIVHPPRPSTAGERSIIAVARSRGATPRRRAGRWGRKGSRGVSEVVATILLLALTVTLFSSIFYFVNTFPQPSPQPTNQFTASLVYQTSGSTTKIVGVSVLHLAGPTVPGSSSVYLYSSAHPTRFTTPFSVTSGLPATRPSGTSARPGTRTSPTTP